MGDCLFTHVTDSPPLLPPPPPQVTFKPDLSTTEVHDENIKGPLKVRQERRGDWCQLGACNNTHIVKLMITFVWSVLAQTVRPKSSMKLLLTKALALHYSFKWIMILVGARSPYYFNTSLDLSFLAYWDARATAVFLSHRWVLLLRWRIRMESTRKQQSISWPMPVYILLVSQWQTVCFSSSLKATSYR